MDSKKVLAKLVKIAHNQQKIIEKLAQETDPNVDYLRRAVQQAAANSNLKIGGYQVSAMPSQTVGTPSGYVINVTGADPNNNLRQTFIRNLKNQVATQKSDQPDLVNDLSILFN